jgi:hypothetical protein
MVEVTKDSGPIKWDQNIKPPYKKSPFLQKPILKCANFGDNLQITIPRKGTWL